MESLLIKARRKKRKTRKCLDEMRKRSQRDLRGMLNVCKINKVAENCIDNTDKTRKDSSITANLLKFNMFKKAVRSETITRPVFAHFKHSNFDNNYMESDILPNIVKNKNDCTVIACREDERARFPREASNNYINMKNFEDNSSDSLILFSPLVHRHSNTCNFNISKDEPAMTSSITAPNRSDENYSYYLYEELMNDIPTYIKNNFTSLIRDNIIYKTRKCLQVLCAKSKYQDQKRLLGTFNNKDFDDDKLPTSKEIIVQNPMDYIRLGWLKRGHHTHEETTSNVSCSTPDSMHSPFVESQNIPSLLSCSPDYDFFPHKLNE